ncbi:hypothetical protein M378DRAFT_182469 [Amanita muscaria Koide BX008]|uniref:Uncharacterized protein n=1 Tax=Amanita muscaria (strain Koide BX008) TaxID=946122 RepID=A0A0C2WDJ2_AMAMK|nr:hypothetical protein M378DRAFT_182469 [Amanita muscaria Koide BX008]
MAHSHLEQSFRTYNNQDFGSGSIQYNHPHQRSQGNLFHNEDIKAAIGSATHDALMKCNNQTYIQLYVKATELEKEVLKAQKDAGDTFREVKSSPHAAYMRLLTF